MDKANERSREAQGASEDTLDLPQAAAMLKCSLQTAQELSSAGELPGCKIGNSWVFLRDALRRYLWEQTEAQQRERRALSGIDKKIAEGVAHSTRRQRRKKGEMANILRELNSPESAGEDTAA